MFINIALLLGWRGNLSLAKVILCFASNASRIAKTQSIKGLVLQLKVAQVTLQQSMGGYKVPNVTLLGQRVSRNGQGLPRNWIPAVHRAHLRNGSILHFKLWMTLFGLYRVLNFRGKESFSSITDPPTRTFTSLLGEYSNFVCTIFRQFVKDLYPRAKVFHTGFSGKPLKALKMLKTAPFIISSASPASKKKKDAVRHGTDEFSILSTSPAGILLSVMVWYQPDNDSLREYLFNWAKMTGNIWLINRMEEWHRLLPSGTFIDSKPGVLGKLGLLPEAAGKIRVVAMVECWTQWMMHPLYQAIAALLRCIPQDGTEDQTGCYERLWKRCPNGPFFCYDLSSATDRLPLVFQQALLSAVFGSWFATIWGVLLVGRPYYIPQEEGIDRPEKVYYQTGQPMGAKSSFHMMALFHHTVIQWAAHRRQVSPGVWFKDYCIVGDDVVISNDPVAAEYLKIMDDLGVKVGLHKSLVSPGKVVWRTRRLCSEFIKKTWYSPNRNMEKPYYDVSALPISMWYMATKVLGNAIDFARTYSLTLNQFLILRGSGYKVRGRIMSRFHLLPRRTRHNILAYFSPLGVNKKSLSEWVSMRSITSRYKFTPGKLKVLISTILIQQSKEILRSMNSPSFLELTRWTKDLITVKRDREYYGTTPRKSDRINLFDDLLVYENNLAYGHKRFLTIDDEGNIMYDGEFITQENIRQNAIKVDRQQYILDQLIELVYREVYMDVIIDIRDIRQETEEVIENGATEYTIEQFETLWAKIHDLDTRISSLPLPKEIYSRVESEIKARESKLVKSWELLVTPLRKTR